VIAADLEQLQSLADKPAYRNLRVCDCAAWFREKWTHVGAELTIAEVWERVQNCSGDMKKAVDAR